MWRLRGVQFLKLLLGEGIPSLIHININVMCNKHRSLALVNIYQLIYAPWGSVKGELCLTSKSVKTFLYVLIKRGYFTAITRRKTLIYSGYFLLIRRPKHLVVGGKNKRMEGLEIDVKDRRCQRPLLPGYYTSTDQKFWISKNPFQRLRAIFLQLV